MLRVEPFPDVDYAICWHIPSQPRLVFQEEGRRAPESR